jgi:muramoyltetrapeptide carboxypeptidase
MNLLKPKKLSPGDTIAIVAPSSCAGAVFPHRIEKGTRALEALGFNVKLFPSVYKRYHGSAGTPEERAQDINEAFADSNVAGIIASIGGLTLNEVLPLLDYESIRRNPKVFSGYSDSTLLHCALQTQAGLVSFYGPSVVTQFGEFPEPLSYTTENFLAAVGTTEPIGGIVPSENWTDEFMEWGEKADLTRPRHLSTNSDAHLWLREGEAKGSSVIGCLPSLLQLKGTKYAPSYSGAILFIETPEGEDVSKGQALSYIDSNLADMRLAGIFDQITGLVVGRPQGHTGQAQTDFFASILRQTRGYTFPILANVNFGHTDPMLTLPFGVQVSMCSKQKNLSFDEAGVVV